MRKGTPRKGPSGKPSAIGFCRVRRLHGHPRDGRIARLDALDRGPRIRPVSRLAPHRSASPSASYCSYLRNPPIALPREESKVKAKRGKGKR